MQQLNKATFSEQLVELIKQRIQNKELRCGDRISEVEIAEACGVSRAPVREALYLLETEGFLMRHPKRGRCVTILTPESVRNNYELCGLLEGAATSSAVAAMGEREWRGVDSAFEVMRDGLSKDAESADGHLLSTEFHKSYLQYAANPLLVEIASRYARVISRYLMHQEWKALFPPEELLERHCRVYETLRANDPAVIEKSVRQHYAESGGRIALLLEERAESGDAELRTRPNF